MSKSITCPRRSDRLRAMGEQNEETSHDKVPEKQEQNQEDFEDTQSHRSRKSSSKSNYFRRDQLKIDAEIKKRKLAQEIVDLELAMQVSKLEQEEVDGTESVDSELQSKRSFVQKWVNTPVVDSTTRGLTSEVGSTCDMSHNQKIESYVPVEFSKFITRQAMPKDLPIFNGDPTEWPNFIFQYENSTAICGYTKEENQCRLQKCLKGNARKIVESLLILPQNVDKIIDILRNRFGRPELIVIMLLDRIRNFPVVKEDKLDMFIDFSDNVKNVVGTMETLNQEDHLRNPILLQELLNKLPTSQKLNWMEYISSRTVQQPKLIEFSAWLDHKASIACQIEIPKLSDTITNVTRDKQKHHRRDVTLTTNNNRTNLKCVCCENESHHLSNCSRFKSLVVDDRWNLVTSKRICFSCLLPSHTLRTCKAIRICGKNQCTKPHHILLHKDNDNDHYKSPQSLQYEVNYHRLASNNVLLKILPITINTNGNYVHTHALLDDASTVTLIDQDLADELHLDGPQRTLSIQWTNHQVRQQEDARIVSFSIMGREESKKYQLRHVWTMKEMSLPTQSISGSEMIAKFPYLGNRVLSMTNARPKVLIGQDNWPLLVNRKIISGPWNGPALSKTLLGWVIHGNVSQTVITFPKKQSPSHVCHTSSVEKDDLDILHDLVKRQWQIDSFGVDKLEKAMSKQDMVAKSIMDRTMKRKGDRFETGLLWKDENIILPESKTVAERRLQCTERKMDKNPLFAKAYCDKMLDLLEKNYVRKLTDDEIQDLNTRSWYLPHFGVFNPNKPDKLRIVFDAASKSNGICINDCLLTGPDLYNSLYDILLNFRIKKFAFTADIKEMFLRIQVRKADRAAQRFLWRGMERIKQPDTYEIMVVYFGSTSGPCLAQEVKNRNAKEFKREFPEAARAIIEDHYMDDYLGNADTEEEAIELITQVINIHRRGGFVICNWITNSDKILQNINPDLQSQGHKNLENRSNEQIERILGAWWNPIDDTFGFQTKFHKVNRSVLHGERRPTKREILKIVMSVFDPIGFVTHFLIQGKVLLQDIWRNKLDWDDMIHDSLYEKWRIWLTDLNKIYSIKIPRQYFTFDRHCSEIQLHVFSDASEKCYATVAYLRIRVQNSIQTTFVTAKARVAPLKPLSIPRLELQAALMGARVGHHLKNNLKLTIFRTFYWTDSKTVLQWIRSEAQRFKVYVAQRLGEIQDLTNSTDWHYIPSKLNPADKATKRSEHVNFSTESLWFSGPEFLRNDMDYWPVENTKSSDHINDNQELRNDYIFMTCRKEESEIPDPDRFSKWNRLRRTMAWLIRFVNNCRTNKSAGELQAPEIQNAEKRLIKRAQQDTFSEEYDWLRCGESLKKTSRLYTYSCKIDEDGIIRLGGRLNNAVKITEDVKEPIILDSSHRITKLIIQHSHEELHHQGQEMLINNLRQKYWILRVRQAVKSLKNTCQKCRNNKATPVAQIMGQLPLCRLEPTIRCFIKTGIDYFGPIKVRVKRSNEKRYGVIFTCMVTRAIHLEIANDLSTDGFIHVLRQFGCRRGFPEEIYSDNGTNFKSAEQEISKCLQGLDKEEITRFCSLKSIKWNFIPPASPNMGGAWERLIRTVKKIMYEMLVTRCPQEFVLRTVFAEIENILNSRPLTHVSMDIDDPEPITPNHFLIGRNHTAPIFTDTDDHDLILISKWKASQRMADFFWKRWVTEYLPFLWREVDGIKKINKSRWMTL